MFRILLARLMTLGLGVALAGTAASAAVAGVAAPLPELGRTVSERMRLLSGDVPLPPGEWVVAGVDVSKRPELNGSDLAAVVLLQVGDARVERIVLVQANMAPLKARPDLSSECGSGDALYSLTPFDDDSGGACGAVLVASTGAVPGSKTVIAPAWEAAVATAKGKGWAIPATLVLTTARTVNRSSLLDIRYGQGVWALGPMREGSTEAACKAATPHFASASDRAAIAGGTRFVDAVVPILDIAARGQLAAGISAPALDGEATNAQSKSDLLRAINNGRVGTLTEGSAAAVALRKELDDPNAAAATDPLVQEMLKRSFWKTVTYRIGTFFDTTAVFTIATGSLMTGAVTSVASGVLGTPILYANETIWGYFGLKSSKSKAPFALPSFASACPPK